MWVILLIANIVTLLLSLALINVFVKIVNYPIYFTSILTLSIYLPLSIVFLLPIDLISSLDDPSSFFYVRNSIVLVAWKANYWITFTLTWAILPFLQNWYDNGQFNTWERFKASAKEVLKFQAILLIAGIFGLIYIIGSVGFNVSLIKSLIITISHIYALLIALWLMSHSLISIPKYRYLNASATRTRLNDYYTKLPKLNEDMNDIKFNLKESCGTIMKLNDLKDSNIEFRDWIISLADQVPEDYSSAISYRGGDPITNDQVNNKFMSKVTKTFNNSYYRYTSMKSQFDDLMDKVFELEDILGAEQSKRLNFRFASSRFTPEHNFYIHKYALPILNKVFAIFLASVSILIIESEILHSTRFSLINLIFKDNNLNAAVFENFTVLIIILTYMLMAALNSLSNIKVFNLYHLSKHQASDPVSVTFFITYAARLTIPLSYNFTMLLNNSNNSFHAFIGKSLTLIPIGKVMNDWLPRLILLPILLSFFNVYERVVNYFKAKLGFEFYSYFEDFEIDDSDETENVDIAKRNSLIQAGQKIAQLEASKILSGAATTDLRPFNIHKNRTTNRSVIGRGGSNDDEEAMRGTASAEYTMNNRISIDTATSNVFADDFETMANPGSTSIWANVNDFFNKTLLSRTRALQPRAKRRVTYESDNAIIPDQEIEDHYDNLDDDENLII